MAKLLGNTIRTSTSARDSNNFLAARVIDIILDINHPRAEEFGGYDGIGTIFYSYVNEPNQAEDSKFLNSAKPFFSFIKQYPLLNEIVLIVSGPNKNYTFAELENTRYATLKYYLPNINVWNHQHNNALPDMVYHLEEKESDNYERIGGSLIRTAEGDNSVEVPLGKYFKENLSIQPLLPFEGDTIVEGRFGNSIRFGATAKEANDKTAYSTKGETGDPITIIRNGALVEENDNGWEHTIENINTDHSTIYLTSNQVLPNFEVVSLHWQSWMAKYDELEVKQKDEFDNITEGFEVESIEPEEPEATADQELEEATEEDIQSQEEQNEDPEDCVDCDNHEGDLMIPEDGKLKLSYELNKNPEEETQEGNNPPPPPAPAENQPTTQTMPPDFGPEKDIVETYRGIDIERTRGRYDGYYVETYEIVEKTYPAGSVEEYVIYEWGGMGSQYGYDTLKESIDEAYEDYEDGFRVGDA